LADLYAIIKTTEALEKALLRDCIKQDEYAKRKKKRIRNNAYIFVVGTNRRAPSLSTSSKRRRT
jgi:hypothetical protein